MQINTLKTTMNENIDFSIIILTHNNLPFTSICLQSILQTRRDESLEIIIVDNASSDKTPLFLEHLSEKYRCIKPIINKVNLGFAPGNNQGASKAEGEFLIFLNNDTIVTENWLPMLRTYLQGDPEIGMIGPVTNSIGNEAKIDAAYHGIEEINSFASSLKLSSTNKTFIIPMLAFYCVMIRRELFEQVGGLDERYSIGMFEDDDMAMKVLQAGYKIACAEDVFIHHFHGMSFKKLGVKTNDIIFTENKRKFEGKWGKVWISHRYRNQP